MQGGRRWSIW